MDSEKLMVFGLGVAPTVRKQNHGTVIPHIIGTCHINFEWRVGIALPEYFSLLIINILIINSHLPYFNFTGLQQIEKSC